MTRKIIIITLLMSSFVLCKAQNIQLHYDFGKGRNYLTSTVEMFKPDKWGNTFFFIDIDYNGTTTNTDGSVTKTYHPSLAYFEIARCLKFWDAPFSAHVEYNGGFLSVNNNYSPINNAYLVGLDYGLHSEDFSKTLNLKALYKYIQGKNNASFQLTAVWNLNFFKSKLTVSGFADFWREDNVNYTNAKNIALDSPIATKYVFITEPQFWYNVTEHLSVGSEIEIASNFSTVHGLKVCPTLAAKWNF